MVLRLVFAGTPEPAVVALRALASSRHEIAAVITRPDAGRGRGRHLDVSAVAAAASDSGIPVLKPRRLGDSGFLDSLRCLEPDACPVVAYGNLIPPDALAIPRLGWINLHFSLLPAWRGAAPVQHAIMHGDDVTGATTFQIEAGLDTGPCFGAVTEAIKPSDTAGDLMARLAESGARLLVATLDALEAGSARPEPQPTIGVSHAPKLKPDDVRVRWAEPDLAIDRRVRAATPVPGSWSLFRGARVKLGPVRRGTPGNECQVTPLAPGEIHAEKAAVWVGTGSRPIALGEVQPPGKRPMRAADWARGVRLTQGERFE